VVAADCDNTLWGGIVGEDGRQGIQLDPHEYPGNIHHAFQRQLVQLVRQGVLLVLCSKNNEADVLEVIDQHPGCFIRREHLSGWRINWQDKARNLEELAAELNLGLDSFVFIDDSPVECGLVRQLLPMVDVLQAPKRVYRLPELLRDYSGFFRLVVTEEDRRRTAQYQAQRQREAERSHAGSLTDYLAGLGLVAEIGPALAEEVPRVAQLTQKTNQFNLTTRRYGEGEIARLHEDPDSLVLCLKAQDRFGDYGLTGVAIVVRKDKSAEIDTFLLSCRILGRRLEDVFLNRVLAAALAAWPVESASAEYLRTRKNAQVADFYERLGFRTTGGDGSQHIRYECVLAERRADQVGFIEVVDRS